MSNETTWTDEQLLSHIALWEKMQRDGETFDFAFSNKLVEPWQGSGYSLDFAGEHVALTLQQGLIMGQWLDGQIKKAMQSKPDPRDTQFANFARLLWDELVHLDDNAYFDTGDADVYRALIARRAYDFVHHGLDSVPFDYDWPMRLTVDEFPDMPAWPESDKPSTGPCPDCGVDLQAKRHDIIHEAWEVTQANSREPESEKA